MKLLCALSVCIFCFMAFGQEIFKEESADTFENKVVAVLKDGQEIFAKELYQGIEQEIYEQEENLYNLKISKLKKVLLKRTITAHPKKKKLTDDEFLNKYVYLKIEPSKKEIEKFAQEKNISKEKLDFGMTERIKEYLKISKKEKRELDFLKKELGENGVTLFFKKPSRPKFDVLVEMSPVFGKKDSKVTIIEYSDFECPYCAIAAKTMLELKRKYADKVRFVYKHFPLSFHSEAKKASNASLCAREQNEDSFWKFYKELYGNSGSLGSDLYLKLAKGEKLDLDRFKKCLDEGKFFPQIESDIESGLKIGVDSTPIFFINGRLFKGALPIDAFIEQIEKELK